MPSQLWDSHGPHMEERDTVSVLFEYGKCIWLSRAVLVESRGSVQE